MSSLLAGPSASYGLLDPCIRTYEKPTDWASKGLALFSAGLLGIAAGLAVGSMCSKQGGLPSELFVTTSPMSSTSLAPSYSAAVMQARAKDVDAPKKPGSAYIQYTAAVRASLVKKNPDKKPTEIAQMLGAMWSALSEKEKQPYYKKFEEQKQRYLQEMESYTPPAEEDGDQDDASTAAKGKRSRKKADKEAPKKPPAAFMQYSMAMRPSVASANPDKRGVEISKVIGEMWSGLSEKQKAPYFAKYEQAKARYLQEMESYTPPAEEDGDQDDASTAAKGKRSRKKADKEANMPKRPLSSYLLFAADMRAKLKKEGSELKATEILQEIGRRWQALSDKGKEKYAKEAQKLKEAYDAEVAALQKY